VAGMDKMGQQSKKGATKGSQSRLAHFGRSKQAVDYPWREFGSPIFAAALGTLAHNGAAIMVGGAAGGRGAVISIYLDGDKDRRYLNDAEDLVEWCHDVLEAFASPSEDIYMAYGLKRREEV
jgi:hypothetical protein